MCNFDSCSERLFRGHSLIFCLLFSSDIISVRKVKMRTPKHKKIMQKAKNTATNKLRKKAMRNKMAKKTLLEVGGDDTREDVRDLMNESDVSFNGVVRYFC